MTKAKMPLEEARGIAQEVKALIKPYCASVVIAGSIRRQKSEVGDIELVCIPSYESERKRVDLFTVADVRINRLDQGLKELAREGIIKPRLKENKSRIAWFGEHESRYIAATYMEKIGVDVFMILPDRDDWYGWHLLLRTGPGDANQLLVTEQFIGGLLPYGVRVKDGIVYKHGEPYPLEDEAAVFELWGFKEFIPANERCVERYKQALKR